MKKNKTKYTFNDFVIANTTRPWFIFNDINDEIINLNHNEMINLIDELNDDSNTNESNPLDMLNFNIESIEKIFENNINSKLDEKELNKINNLSTYEKLNFLKSNEKLISKLKDENLFKNINYLLSMFKDFELIDTGLNLVSDQAIEHLINTYKNEFNFNDNDIKKISDKQSNEIKIKETEQAIKNGFKLIINPHFEYKDCISKVFYIDIKNGIFGNLIYSLKTKRKHLLKSYFDFNIIKNYVQINKIKILKPIYQHNKNIKKYVLKFAFTDYCSTSKTGTSSQSIKNIFSESEINAIYESNPNYQYSKQKKKIKLETIIEHVKNDLKSADYDFDEKLSHDEMNNKNSIYTCSFLEFLNLIKNKDNISIDWKLNEDDFKNNFDSGWFNILTKKIYPEYNFGAKKFFKLLAGFLPKYNDGNYLFKQSTYFFKNNMISINPSIEDMDEYKAINDIHKKIAWFDFEGVTLPIPLVDYLKAWNQTISQTSIIKTHNNKIYEKNNYVYDPLGLNLETYKKIIDDLYDEEISYYIVYNKSYEKTRLQELIDRMKIYLQNNEITFDEYQEYNKKNNFIINNMIDLANFFSSNDNKNAPLISDRYINIGYIRDSYSIKKLEYYVTSNNIDKELEHKIKPYSELNVKNGSAALSIATTRALNKIRDREWEQKIKDLKEYCENDVMAMLMVADLIKLLMKNKKEYFKNYEKYNF